MASEQEEYEDMWEVLGKARFVIWFCPDRREHERKHGANAPLRQTVEWVDGVAHCLEPGCGNKSTDKKEELVENKTLNQMLIETREIQTEKGWREAGKTYGDYIALLHSEVAEALEAFRKVGLEDMTEKVQQAYDGVGLESVPVKPEGVGSELADVLIRFLDTADVIGLAMVQKQARRRGSSEEVYPALDDIESIEPHMILQRRQAPGPLISFGDHLAWLDRCISQMWMDPEEADSVLIALMTIARKYGFDMMAEYERKQAHNRTREYRHGGKLL